MARRTAEQKQGTIKEKVRAILELNEEARNSDGYLEWLYGRWHVGLDLPYLDFVKLRTLNFDSLTRARRYWQNQRGLFPPTDPRVREARRRKSQAMKKVFRAN